MEKEMFNPASLQLQRGVNLVEASAGTGKTFAIAMLVLRFVTEKEIPLEKILIVTFTKAATKELRGRIRRRLVEARNLLECAQDKAQWENFDPPLQEWGERVMADGRQQRSGLLLQKALYSIDQAPVFTIHGFCQRMLGEQALESNQPFDCELLTDIDSLKMEIAQDYWRTLFYRKSGVATILFDDGRFRKPEALLTSINKITEDRGGLPFGDFEKEAATCSQRILRHLTGIRRWWLDYGKSFLGKICEAERSGYLKKNSTFSKKWQEWIEELRKWCCSDSASGLFSYPEWLAKETFLEKKFLKKANEAFLDEWDFYPEAAEFLEELERLPLVCRCNFAHFLQKELALRLTHQGYMSHDSSILNLAGALQQEGGQLQSTLAGRFDVALIDEFQDTDSRQYSIFAAIFDREDKYLYLIGDPKQAIYSFRGADIYSYFTARKAADRLLILDTNYRSHPLLIKEINRLFAERQDPFFYDESILPFSCVAPRTKGYEELTTAAGDSANGMVYWLLPPCKSKDNLRWSKADAQPLILQHTVAEIGRLLAEDSFYIHADGEKRRLTPQDVAVLVRSNGLAEDYANALADMGIPAVVNGRSSVFFSDECRDLLLLLAAILVPNRLDRVKAALSLSWFGHDGKELYDLDNDEKNFMGDWQLSLMKYARKWHESGFFSMMARLLKEENVFAHLAGDIRGERRIANLRQLLRVIEEEALARNLLPQELYQWLLRQYNGAREAEESELLLESDRDAVKIVTMHSAKGLEYGVVFCVDLWGGSDRLTSEKNQILCRENGDSFVDLGSENFDVYREQAKQEARAEDLRLLYVALTRAKMRCYLVWADVKGASGKSIDSFISPLGYLLFPSQKGKENEKKKGKKKEAEKGKEDVTICDYSCQQERISALRNQEKGIFIQVLEELPTPIILDFSSSETKLKKSELRRDDFSSSWCLSSFSSLAGLREYELEEKNGEEKENGTDVAVMGLPGGVRFGSMVHDILEKNSFPHLALCDEKCVEWCAEIASRYGVTADSAKMAKLMQQTVTAPITNKKNGDSFSLTQLMDNNCVKEMPFHLFHGAVKTDEMCELLKDDPAVIPLIEKKIEGYLTGFIDLVCKWKGRYYIMDYKTNHLGNSLADYQEDGLLTAMRSHNYGLQYWLYTVALHRYLARMEENYEYTRHFGGVFYLFVRGMTADSPGSGVFFTVPPSHKVQELDDLLGGNP